MPRNPLDNSREAAFRIDAIAASVRRFVAPDGGDPFEPTVAERALWAVEDALVSVKAALRDPAQRMARGWSDTDAWNAGDRIPELVGGMVGTLRLHLHSYGHAREEDWEEIGATASDSDERRWDLLLATIEAYMRLAQGETLDDPELERALDEAVDKWDRDHPEAGPLDAYSAPEVGPFWEAWRTHEDWKDRVMLEAYRRGMVLLSKYGPTLWD